MVYCGKPSKGCLSCRSRKTRCDRQVPSCGQCIRAKRECPGYRNQLDLMFRNESEAVIGKATTKKIRKPKSSSTTTNPTPRSGTPTQTPRGLSPVKSSAAHDALLPIVVDIPEALSPSLEDRALSFYKNKTAIWLQNFDIVETISNQGNTDDHLLATLSAVGLASYAASVRSPQLMYKARKNYGKALFMTNAALKSQAQYTTDSTLFSVLALGVFEAVAGNGQESLSAWAKHLAGASELVRLRGPAQFMTEAGQRMFLQISSNLMVDCVQHGRPMPAHILAYRKASEPFVNIEDPAWRISNTIISFTNLRATVMHGKTYSPRRIVEEALGIEATFEDIVEKLPPPWRSRTVQSDENPDAIWNGVYHVYQDFWTVQMLNTMRIFRVHAAQIIREQLDLLTPDFDRVFPIEEADELRKRAVSKMLAMQDEILAAAPQYARWGVSSFPADSPDEPWQIYQFLWPLFLCGNMDISSPKVISWVLNRFLVIAKEAGVEHAAVFAESMRKRHDINTFASTEEKERLANPLRMDPFDFNLDGWVLAHGVILSAQVNKPKVAEPSIKPKANLSNIPPGWTGGPPPGWTGGPPPGWKGGPPPGWKGGPPPGWKGGPPPGWKGGPPQNLTSPSRTSPSSNSSNSPPPGRTTGPPPGWTWGPPPGWKGGPPPGWNGPSLTNSSTLSPSNTLPPPSNGPPPGWTGPPPPGWQDGPPSTTTTNSQGPSTSINTMQGPPPGWTGPPPPGWIGNISPAAPNLDSSAASNELETKLPGPPPGWVGPPPPGWTGGSPNVLQKDPKDTREKTSGQKPSPTVAA